MTIKHICYTNDQMTISADKCKESALKYGANNSRIWRSEDIAGKESIQAYIIPHFCDWWVWKPQIIHSEMYQLNDGDIIAYSDSGIEFVGDLRTVINSMGNEDIFLFSNGWKHAEWTKGDVFAKFGIEPDMKQEQVQASLIFIRVSEYSKRIVSEWKDVCEYGDLITDNPSSYPNVPTFAAHRNDQSILGTIAQREGIKLHWYPVLTAMHLRNGVDQYPAIADHHRRRNHEW